VRSWLEKLDQAPIGIFVVASLTLGLAPFVPEPHVWEKLKMLAAGELSRPIDIFDLLLHGAPWLLLGLKLLRQFGRGARSA
jgi:hypothetical protein